MLLKKLSLLFATLFFFTVACEEPVYAPKPRAFPKVEYPERAYQQFGEGYCDFTFEYPTYAKIIQETTYFDEKPASDCWFDIYLPAFDSRIHCSYYPVTKENNFEKLKSDAFNLAGKHNIKANYIDELPIKKNDGTTGFAFDIDGPVASPFQFFLTDSTQQHFMRGALYFRTQARPDSLAPVYEFIKKDVMQLINTFEWELE